MRAMELHDRLFFPILQPPVAGNLAVVLVDLAITLFPVIELLLAQPQPGEQLFRLDLGALRPVLDVIDDGVARLVGNPAAA